MKVFSRREYDVRFIHFNEPLRASERFARLDEEILRSYPGNLGQFQVFIKALGEDYYAVAITPSDLMESVIGKTVSIPLLMLPAILKRARRAGYFPGPDLALVLWLGKEGELILFDGGAHPITSRLCTKAPQGRALWVFIGPEKSSVSLPEEGISLFKGQLSPTRAKVGRGHKTEPSRARLYLSFLSLLLLLLFNLALLRIRVLQEEEMKELKKQVSIEQENFREKAALMAEIDELKNRSIIKKKIGPYWILSKIIDLAPGDLSIRRFDLEGSSFSLEGMAVDPISFSGSLSGSGLFKEINISRIRKTEGGISFMLKGEL